MSDRQASAIRSTIVRAIVTNAQVGPRTILQVQMLANEDSQAVELLQSPGRSSNPAQGTDVVVLQITGTRDHLVALGGDSLGLAITDLLSGEFGDQDARGNRIAYRVDQLEVAAPLKLVITTPHFITSALPTSASGLSAGEYWVDSSGFVHQVPPA
jgi:phage gp45-like